MFLSIDIILFRLRTKKVMWCDVKFCLKSYKYFNKKRIRLCPLYTGHYKYLLCSATHWDSLEKWIARCQYCWYLALSTLHLVNLYTKYSMNNRQHWDDSISVFMIRGCICEFRSNQVFRSIKPLNSESDIKNFMLDYPFTDPAHVDNTRFLGCFHDSI